ncbi:MAG: cellulase family glycosylhydrolase [Bacteroidales bacterium]|nr:cellulase family glycosylhydrolase [Bacteroidales bacterium]
MTRTNRKLTVLGVSLMIFISSVFAQNFYISNHKFYYPDGKEFIPLGANVNVWNYFDWPQNIWSAEHQDIITNCWKFNILRAPVSIYPPVWDGYVYPVGGFKGQETTAFEKFDAVVDIYTAKGVVIMFDAHDWICKWPTAEELEDIKDFWRLMAERYKNNPYVWFNLVNEPGWESPVPIWYRDFHQQIIGVIRNEAGANNMIIIDGSQCGQDAGTWDNNPITTANSGILTYGSELQNFWGQSFSNIGFSIHLYDQWAYGDQKLDVKLRDFIDRVHAKGFALLIGEVGSTTGDVNMRKAPQLGYDVALKEKGVGLIAWHYDPFDGFKLMDDGSDVGGGVYINSCTNPTNLSSWFGYYFWRAVHTDGYGLDGTPTTPPTGQTPYTGTAISLPGTVQAENFDKGGEGVAYHDNDASNNGGQYRTSDGVDIESCSAGGYNIGWTNNGEWLEYTVNVASAGSYAVTVSVASAVAGTKTLDIVFSNGNVNTGNISFTHSNGWQTWHEVTASGVSLNAGEQVMRVNLKSGNINLNYIKIAAGATTGCTASGSILMERYNGISGTAVSNLTSNSNYPDNPSSTANLTQFEIPTNAADNYGARVRGYICAPATGNYTFWIAGDDNVELWLSTDNAPANKVKIASHTGWTSVRQWNKYTSQKSAAKYLTAGNSYYVEALLKEGAGGDNLAVGWAKPGESTSAPSQVIPGSVLSPATGSTPPPPPPSGGSLVTNYEFDNGTTGWSTWGGSSSIAVVTGAGMSGANAGKVTIPTNTTNRWDVGLSTSGINFTNGTTYNISFMAKAAASKPVTVDVLDNGTWKQGFYPTIGTAVATYSYNFTASSTSTNYQINFQLGGNTSAFWIDKVAVTAGAKSAAVDHINKPQQEPMFELFPNPGNGTINIGLSGFQDDAQVNIYNMSGALVQQHNLVGNYTKLDVNTLAKGIYMVSVF